MSKEKSLWDHIVDFFTFDQNEEKNKEKLEKPDITDLKKEDIRQQILEETGVLSHFIQDDYGKIIDDNKNKITFSHDYDKFGYQSRHKTNFEDLKNGKINEYFTNCGDAVIDMFDYHIKNGYISLSQEEQASFEKARAKGHASAIASFAVQQAKNHGGEMFSGEDAFDVSNYKPGHLIYFASTSSNNKHNKDLGHDVGHIAVVDLATIIDKDTGISRETLIIRNFTGNIDDNGGKNETGKGYSPRELSAYLESKKEENRNIYVVDGFPQYRNAIEKQIEQMVQAKLDGNNDAYNQMLVNLQNPSMMSSHNIAYYQNDINQQMNAMTNKIQASSSYGQHDYFESSNNNDNFIERNSIFKI